MTSRDFVYWLKGYFEMAKPQKINSEGVVIIKKHIELVLKYEKNKPTLGFINWLNGFFDAKIDSNLKSNDIIKIGTKLTLEFKDEIDPIYGYDKPQYMLNEIHDNTKLIC